MRNHRFDIPKAVQFLFCVFLTLFCVNLIYRLAFLVFFKPSGMSFYSHDMLYATYLGIKFDLRLTAFIILPLLILAYFIGKRLICTKWIRIAVNIYITACFMMMLVFFGFDFGVYSYIRNRINSSLFMFLDNPDISFSMICQSYPVFWISSGFIVLSLLFGIFIFRKAYSFSKSDSEPGKKTGFTAYLIFTLLVLAVMYGRVSRFPLRWSEAYFTTDGFVSNYTFNPVLYFYDSFKVKPHNYDLKEAQKAYSVLADFYGIESPAEGDLSLLRRIKPEQRFDVQPNIVIILLETFASFKTGAFGNQLDPSPNFDRLSKEGLLFKRFYVPMENTSRSIFCSLFGIPDVSAGYYSSKNPLVVEQHTILNALKDHEKLYFLGGSANWGNIRGILSYNIEGLKIYEEGSYSSPVHDVWGISDADLFFEANEVLSETGEPFFAFIQTAGNHRPFKIPDDPKGFIEEDIDEAVLAENGFYSLKEYNGFRFLDHCLGYYFSIAGNEGYFENTIFIIYGDHGTNGGAIDRRFGDLALASYSVPMLIYSPKLISEPEIIEKTASSLDIMPTIAGLAGKPYINKTLGRDLFDTECKVPNIAFTFTPFRNPPRYGLLMDEFYVNVEPDGNYSLFYRDKEMGYSDIKGKFPEKAEYMAGLCRSIYEYSRYLLYNNKKIADRE